MWANASSRRPWCWGTLPRFTGRREWPSPSLKLAPGATPPSPPSGPRPSVVALPRLGGLGSCWGSIRFRSESRPGQVGHGRLVVGSLRCQWLTVVVSSLSCSVGARGTQHGTGRGRWTPGTGASSPSPRTGPGPPVSGDWAGRNSNLTRGGLSGSVALCADFDEGSLAGPLMGWGQVPAGGSLRAPRRPTNHCLWYPAWFVLFPFTLSRYPQWQPISNGHRSFIVAAMQVAITLETSRLSVRSCPTGAAAANFSLVLLAPSCVALRSASVL